MSSPRVLTRSGDLVELEVGETAPTALRQLVVVNQFTGHRLMYVRLLVEQILGSGHAAIIGVPAGATESDEWRVHCRDIEARSLVVELADATLASVVVVSRTAAADLVLLPDGDRFLLPLLRSRGWRGCGRLRLLVMRSGVARGIRGPFVSGTKMAVGFLLKRLGIEVLRLASTTKVRLDRDEVRDPMSAMADTMRPIHLPSDVYWFGVLGAITPRKNIDAVLRAAALTSTPCGVLIAGKTDSGLLDTLLPDIAAAERAGVRVLIDDRVLEEDTFWAYLRAVDCVVLAHSNEGPSGILGRALATRRAVIAAGARSLRRDCRRAGVGAMWVPLDVKSIASAMDETARRGCASDMAVLPPSNFALRMTEFR